MNSGNPRIGKGGTVLRIDMHVPHVIVKPMLSIDDRRRTRDCERGDACDGKLPHVNLLHNGSKKMRAPSGAINLQFGNTAPYQDVMSGRRAVRPPALAIQTRRRSAASGPPLSMIGQLAAAAGRSRWRFI